MRPATSRRSGARRWTRLGLVSVLLLAGCQSWRASSLGPERLIEEERPASIRVTLEDGRVATLTDPTLVSDTIVGTGAGGIQRTAVSEVQGLEVRRTSVPKIAALVLANVTTVVTVIALIVDLLPHYY